MRIVYNKRFVVDFQQSDDRGVVYPWKVTRYERSNFKMTCKVRLSKDIGVLG